MNKSELVARVAAKTGQPAKVVSDVVDAVLEGITEAVSEGEPAAFVGFGTFTAVTRAARTGRNPQTGGAMELSARVVPKFSPGSVFKTRVRTGKHRVR